MGYMTGYRKRRRPWKWAKGERARWTSIKRAKARRGPRRRMPAVSALHEKKLLTPDTPQNNPGTAGVVSPLLLIAQGDTVSSRDGQKIVVSDMFFRVQVTHPSSDTNQIETIRLSIIQDKWQIADTAPTFLNIYDSVGPHSYLNITSFPGRFNILRTKTFTLDKDQFTRRNINWFVRKKIIVRYNGTATTDIAKNGVYLVSVMDSSPAAGPTITWHSRVRWYG